MHLPSNTASHHGLMIYSIVLVSLQNLKFKVYNRSSYSTNERGKEQHYFCMAVATLEQLQGRTVS